MKYSQLLDFRMVLASLDFNMHLYIDVVLWTIDVINAHDDINKKDGKCK